MRTCEKTCANTSKQKYVQKAYLELLLKNDCNARSLFRQKRWGCTEEDSQFNEPVAYGCAIGKSFASKWGSETYIAYTRILSCET